MDAHFRKSSGNCLNLINKYGTGTSDMFRPNLRRLTNQESQLHPFCKKYDMEGRDYVLCIVYMFGHW